MGLPADEDSSRPFTPPLGAAGHHDQHLWPNPAVSGEVDPESDGPVRQ